MRDIIFKALTSVEGKKQDLCIRETSESDGVLARTERHCRYFIIGKADIEKMDDFPAAAEEQFANMPLKKRHYYILKAHDSKHCEDRLICKLAGSFYAVYGGRIYCIAYVHSFKIRFTLAAEGTKHEEDYLA